MKKKRIVRLFAMAGVMMLVVAFMAMPAYAAGGNVSGAIEGTWSAAQGQIKDIVNNVVFPVIDMILAVLLFVKIATAYMDYRKHGQFEFTAPAILFAWGIWIIHVVQHNTCAGWIVLSNKLHLLTAGKWHIHFVFSFSDNFINRVRIHSPSPP